MADDLMRLWIDVLNEARWTSPPKETKDFVLAVGGKQIPIQAEKTRSGKWLFHYDDDPWVIDGAKVIRKQYEGSWVEVGTVDKAGVIQVMPVEQIAQQRQQEKERRELERKRNPEPQHVGGNIVYAQGSPYGAPKVMIRGGATRSPIIKQYLRSKDFMWDDRMHAYVTYLDKNGFLAILKELEENYGCSIRAKHPMDTRYIFPEYP